MPVRHAQDRRIVADAKKHVVALGDAGTDTGDEVEFGRAGSHAVSTYCARLGRFAAMVTQRRKRFAAQAGRLADPALSGTIPARLAAAAHCGRGRGAWREYE